MSGIHVKVCRPDLGIAAHWQDLATRASINVFMDPVALCTVHATDFADVHVLLAWQTGLEADRLVGLWAVQKRDSSLRPSFLAIPPYDYAFVSNPVVDPACMDEVMAAFFDAIEREPALPKLIRLKYLDGECGAYGAIVKALAARGSQTLTLAERTRPFISREHGRKDSGSTRKKLRQDWNRLSAQGEVDIVNDRECARVRDAFETFLALEAQSWKGARGTALLSSDTDAAFARKLIGNLAAQESASVALLRLAGEPIAAQVLLYGGGTAYTWKTAFDTQFAKYSPGALLVDRITDQLFPAIGAIESCSPEGGFMAQLWAGRRTTIDLLFDVRSQKSVGFAMAATFERGRTRLRGLRGKFRSAAAARAARKSARKARHAS